MHVFPVVHVVLVMSALHFCNFCFVSTVLTLCLSVITLYSICDYVLMIVVMFVKLLDLPHYDYRIFVQC